MKGMRLGDVGKRRRQSGADRPDRLISEDDPGQARRGRHRSVELAGENIELRPASRSARVSPIQTMAVRPARSAARPERATCASVSAWSVRRSELTDDNEGRAGILQHSCGNVARMGTESFSWQVWPPMATVLPAHILRRRQAV